MLPGQTYTPEDILRIAWRRKWVIAAPFVIVTVAAILFTSTLPDKYRSETVILVVPQRVPESYVRSTITLTIGERLQTLQQQILSRSRLEPIIKEFDLYPEERRRLTMEEVVELMRPTIQVDIEGNDSFRISYENADPLLAQKVTERLATHFINENQRDRELLAEGTNQFLDSELEDAKRKLIEHEKRLEAYRLAHAGELPTQVDINLQAIHAAQLQLQTLAESMNRDRERRLLLERQLIDLQNLPVASASGAAAGPNGPTSTAEQLGAAETRLRELELRYKPEHPDVIATKRLIGELQAKLEIEMTARSGTDQQVRSSARNAAELARQSQMEGLRRELDGIDRQLADKADESARLQKRIAEYQAKVDAAPRRESELIELTRDYSTLQQAYTSLLARREDSRIAANLERRQVGEQFRVLDPARVPERPFSPKRWRLNAMAAIGGLGLGLAMAALLEYRDRSFRRAADVARVLQLPVLAAIPLMETPHAHAPRRAFIAVAVVLALLSVCAGVYAAWRVL